MAYQVGSIADLISGPFLSSNVNYSNEKKSKKKSTKIEEIETHIITNDGCTSKIKNKKNKKLISIPEDDSTTILHVAGNAKRCFENEDSTVKPKKKKLKLVGLSENASILLNNTDSKKKMVDAEDALPATVNGKVKNKKKVKKAEGKMDLESSEEKKSRTVFIGNLPNTYTRQKLSRTFAKFGKVENVRLRCAPVPDMKTSKKVANIRHTYHKDRTNICGFVCFTNIESAKKAVAVDGMILDNHHLRIDFSAKHLQETNEPNKAIFVGNLAFGAEEDELWSMFENCGAIRSVRIVRDNVTSIGKGIGYVNFESAASVELALQLDGQEIRGRPIRVKSYSLPKIKHKNRHLLNLSNDANALERIKKKKEKQKLKEYFGKTKPKVDSSGFSGHKADKKKKAKREKPSKEFLKKKKFMKILTT